MTLPTASTSSGSEWWLGIERFVIFAIVTFGAQVTIGGQALDVSSASGRAAVVSGILSALYVVGRKYVLGR